MYCKVDHVTADRAILPSRRMPLLRDSPLSYEVTLSDRVSENQDTHAESGSSETDGTSELEN